MIDIKTMMAYGILSILAFINLFDLPFVIMKGACFATVLTYAFLVNRSLITRQYNAFIMHSLLTAAVLSTSGLIAAHVLMGTMIMGALAVVVMLFYKQTSDEKEEKY